MFLQSKTFSFFNVSNYWDFIKVLIPQFVRIGQFREKKLNSFNLFNTSLISIANTTVVVFFKKIEYQRPGNVIDLCPVGLLTNNFVHLF